MRNPLTIEALAEWLDENPGKRFDIGDTKNCAVTQYARAIGHERSTCSFDIMTADGDFLCIPGLFALLNDNMADAPETFGALATRLRS